MNLYIAKNSNQIPNDILLAYVYIYINILFQFNGYW